jgi:hypothetical protein
MIVELVAVTSSLAVAVLGVTVGLIALLVRGLRSIDVDEEPAWWDDFERQLRDYMARRSHRPPTGPWHEA